LSIKAGNAAAGAADGVFAAHLLVEGVEEAVPPGHQNVGAIAQEEAPANVDTALLEVLDLAQEDRRSTTTPLPMTQSLSG
jgi:hypothetical protein